MTNPDLRPATDRIIASTDARLSAASRYAAETNAMTFDMTGIRADRSKNFSRIRPRTKSSRKTIR